MIISIPKAVFEPNREAFAKKPYEWKLEWRDALDVDLEMLGVPAMKELRAVIAADLSLRGAKTLVRDLDIWIGVQETGKGIKTAKARNLKQAAGLLIQLVRQNPHKHIYERLQGAAEGVVVPYFVSGIRYREPSRNYPPYIEVRLVHEEFDLKKMSSFTLHHYEIVGRTAYTILHESGYLTETPPMRADYEHFIERYADIKDRIGKQFYAVGQADDSGIDGNGDGEDRWWRSSRSNNFILDKNGEPARVVIDVFRETDKKDRNSDSDKVDLSFWSSLGHRDKDGDGDYDPAEDDTAEETQAAYEIPVHPYVACFDLRRHKRLRIHVGNLAEYVYDRAIRERLILPKTDAALIDTLIVETGRASRFRDVVVGKAGGTIILCQGSPGTGKTLTAEIYAEALERPLYTVQCAQLGVTAEDMEDNLMEVLARGRRWNAVMLLDESDVYIHKRGNDLVQNAIVGVFLRVLEYHAGVLFLTTNRGDLVDDAILSRCTARVNYGTPSKSDQYKIWRSLLRANDVVMDNEVVKEIVVQNPTLSGRDIKNLLKLAMLVADDRKCDITPEIIAEVKVFKPTCE